jgi:GntR family transcriptional regulator
MDVDSDGRDLLVKDKELDFSVDGASFVPYYVQIASQVRSFIQQGRIQAGQSFFSEAEIAAKLGISKMPVRQAFQKLRSEGWLVTAKGKKPVIGTGRVPWNFRELRGFSEEMRGRGLEPGAKVLALSLCDPDAVCAKALKLSAGEKVYVLKRLRYVDHEPVAIVTSYLPSRLFPGLEEHRFADSLYQIVEEVYKRKLGYAEEIIGAASASPEEAQVLETVSGAALLLIRETTWDIQQTPVEYSVSLLRGDRYTASVTSARGR